MISDKKFDAIHSRLKKLIDIHLESFSKDSATEIQHFFKHDEIERALELFILSAMEESIPIPNISKETLKQLVLSCSLDEEENTFYRPDFFDFVRPFLESGE